MKLVEFTAPDGEKTYLNPDEVWRVAKSRELESGPQIETRIDLGSGVQFVCEDVETVLHRLQN